MRETSTSSPSIFTGYTGTGRVAGRPDGLPVRRSNAEPCSQHSIWQSSTSPSESETFAWEQMSWMANTSPSVCTTETGEIVGAGHASATGRFDDEQLFYLMARGIPADEARRLVVRGFFAELVQQIGVDDIEERLLVKIDEELEATV